jgi:general secretion pathway protein A
MDYFSILNLNKEPFSNSPDPEFFFHSRQHLDCLQKLELSLLLRRGLNVIIGDVGTGKTTLCRQLIRRFAQKDKTETYLILDPHFLYPSEFLATVVKLLTGKKPPSGIHDWQVKEYIKQYLFRKGVDQDKTIVLIIDEGQKIPAFCLEILREFLNFETNEYKLLQIVIFAQSEFEKKVRKYPNFSDRISLYHLLKPLSFSDTRRMIKFRLEKSSKSSQKLNLFTYPALWTIFRITGGYPRKIINLCHQSILAMIIHNRSRSNYFIVRKCARRMFREKSGRSKFLIATAVASGAAAVILLATLPLDRFKTGESHEIRETKANNFLDPNLKIAGSIPDVEVLSHDDRMVPGDFKNPTLLEAEVIAAVPEKFEEPAEAEKILEEPAVTERIQEDVPSMASVDTAVDVTPNEMDSEPTYSEILGQITVKPRETLSRVIRQVYGGFDANYLKAFIIANPAVTNPDRVAVGQIISLPAIPVEVTTGDTPVWWIKLDETDTLEAAFKILRNRPEAFPRVQLIPYWNPVGGSKFAIVLDKLFNDEKSARAQQKQLPAQLAPGSKIFSHWEGKTVFFANPYFDQTP